VKSLRWLDPTTHRVAAVIGLCVGALAAGRADADGLIAYEFGTAEIGPASAGY